MLRLSDDEQIQKPIELTISYQDPDRGVYVGLYTPFSPYAGEAPYAVRFEDKKGPRVVYDSVVHLLSGTVDTVGNLGVDFYSRYRISAACPDFRDLPWKFAEIKGDLKVDYNPKPEPLPLNISVTLPHSPVCSPGGVFMKRDYRNSSGDVHHTLEYFHEYFPTHGHVRTRVLVRTPNGVTASVLESSILKLWRLI